MATDDKMDITEGEKVEISKLFTFSMESTLSSLITRSNVRSVLCKPHFQLITIPANASLPQAVNILSTNKIQSAPVQGVRTGNYLGFMDMFDFLCFILNLHNDEVEVKEKGKEERMHDAKTTFELTTVAEIINLSDLDPLCTVSEVTPLYILLTHFASGIHRCAVGMEDNESEIINIVSQSDVIRFIARSHHVFGKNLASATIGTLNLGTYSIVSMHMNAPVIQAFQAMRDKSISAVAVTDDAHHLVANLSITDLRSFDASFFSALHMPISKYIMEFCPDRIIPPISVTSSTTFETLVLKFAVSGVHRVWILNDDGQAVGVISLSDVMKQLLSFVS